FFHKRGARVFVDYNPWDVGTRREGVDDAAAVAEVVRRLDADGVFLDTMKEALPELRAAVDHDAWVEEVRGLLADPDERRALGRAMRRRFERRLSADCRAALLERLLADDGWRARPARERATLWREHDPAPDPREGRRAAPAGNGRPSVVVAGFYGARNAGDELILHAVAGRLTAAGGRVVVAAQRPEEVERLHDLEAFSRLDLEATEAHVRRASAVVVGGGGLFHDYSFLRAGGLPGVFRRPGMSVGSWVPPMVMAAALDRPVHLYGLGVGPLTDPDARHLVGWLAGRAASVSVRDAPSRALLRELPGAPAEVEQVADPVYALDLGDEALAPGLARMAAPGGLVAVIVRPWADPAMDGLDERIGQALTGVARRHGVAVLGIAFHADHDEPALAEVMGHLRADVPRLTLPWTRDAATLAAVLRGCRAVLSMRLHGALLAHRVGTPCVGLAYDPKVAAHFAEVGEPEACLGLDTPRPALTRALEAAVAAPRDAWAGRVAELEADARSGLDRLAGHVEASLPAAAPAR
ncbi:MAG TPA: polysaccharide pyruvyl transferase family protein, partial [Solirubrobacteraceae bacterium]